MCWLAAILVRPNTQFVDKRFDVVADLMAVPMDGATVLPAIKMVG
jgi:hypothetical protein